MSGKGSKYRRVNGDVYRQNYDQIFGSKDPKESSQRPEIVDHDLVTPRVCPDCSGLDPMDHSDNCSTRWGRRGWRQLGVYDG